MLTFILLDKSGGTVFFMRPPLLQQPEHPFFHRWTAPLLSSLAFLTNSQASSCLEQCCPPCLLHLSKMLHYTCPSEFILVTCSAVCFSQSCVSDLQCAPSRVSERPGAVTAIHAIPRIKHRSVSLLTCPANKERVPRSGIFSIAAQALELATLSISE